MSFIDQIVKDIAPQVINAALAAFVNKPISIGPIHLAVAGADVTVGPIPVQIKLAAPSAPAQNPGPASVPGGVPGQVRQP